MHRRGAGVDQHAQLFLRLLAKLNLLLDLLQMTPDELPVKGQLSDKEPGDKKPHGCHGHSWSQLEIRRPECLAQNGADGRQPDNLTAG